MEMNKIPVPQSSGKAGLVARAYWHDKRSNNHAIVLVVIFQLLVNGRSNGGYKYLYQYY